MKSFLEDALQSIDRNLRDLMTCRLQIREYFSSMNFKGDFKSREHLFHLLGLVTRLQKLPFLIQSHFHFTIHRRQLNFVTKRSEKRHEKVHSKSLTRKKLSIEKSEARSEKEPRRRKARIYPPSKVFSLVFKHH